MALLLKWSDFSADARTVKVARANVAGVLAEPKTESGVRVVPVFDRERKAILAHKLASSFSSDDDLVLPTPVGTPHNPRLLVPRALAATIKKAGLPAKAVRFHGLRHLAVSALIAEGAPILTVSRIAGHSDPSVTLKVYSHLLGDDLLAAADKFDPMRQAV